MTKHGELQILMEMPVDWEVHIEIMYIKRTGIVTYRVLLEMQK